MFEKLKTVESRYETLMGRISDAAVQADSAEYRTHTKALAGLQPLVDKVREHKALEREMGETCELVLGDDDELRKLAEQELRELGERRDAVLAEIKILLLPRDPNDERNVVLEIRAGTGRRRRRGCSPRTCSGCIHGSPSRTAGAWRCCRSTRPVWGPSRKSSP